MWSYYVKWDLAKLPELVPRNVFRISSDGIVDRWNAESKFWDAIPGDSISRSIENGDVTLDLIPASKALEIIGANRLT